MNIGFVFLGLMIILIGMGIFFLMQHFNTGKPKNSQASTPARKIWQVWLLYFGIAFILAIWTVYGALFFLGITLLLYLDPGTDASITIGNNEKKNARRIYTWLFWSPLITVSIFIAQLFNLASTVNDQVLVALIPSLLHIPLLLGLTSKSRFVFRHTQQGILFIALRAGMASLAAVNINNHLEYAVLLFFIGNGTLWLSSSIFGWNQIYNGTCWLMDRKGEQIISQEPQPINKVAQPVTEPDKKLEQFLGSMNTKEKQTAKEKALEAFQSGIQGEVRKNALNILSILGEVEKF
jgi:hypothetical protein